ncbi:Superkiller protein 3 [Serendipita sp. 396]|nr:Superkiller protein 3 [Serendipita sp. 396]KAG8789126.1 Superkiller protein 3 [Serendipita sp. 397]KAG8804182.1 Superkiller protein 3 [Serendipita sp. 398]KAG8877281.1 Superkiller protein 3 [Serendipita sp. 405]
MATAKAQLKLTRDLISKKDYKGAYDAANRVLRDDPVNYNGLVFLALSCLELNDNKRSEEAYRAAIKENESQPLAWQGISRLYERTEQWEPYAQALLKLADLFSASGDFVKCAESISKLIDTRRKHGSTIEIIQALSLLLDGSPYHATLSNLPEPDASSPTASTVFDIQSAIYNSLPIVQEIIQLTEQFEQNLITQQIQARRTRIDAPPLEQLKVIVKREVWSASKLESLYEEVLNHPRTDDELRRSIEASLLQRKRERLWSLDSADPAKEALRQEVTEMVNGIVLLKIPNEFAWCQYFETADFESIDEYNLRDIRMFLTILPDSHMAQLWRAWLRLKNLPENEEEEFVLEDDSDPLDWLLDLWQTLPESVLLRRVTALLQWKQADYQNAIKAAEAAMRVLSDLQAGTGLQLSKTLKSLNVILACSLVHLYPPKYHARALRILDPILEEDLNQVDCRLARGYVHQVAGRWVEAQSDFDQVVAVVAVEDSRYIEAAEEAAWCQVQAGEVDLGKASLERVIEILESGEDETAQARAWWRLGRATWEEGNPGSYQESYKHWITALKRSSVFASAYTSLGVYYADYIEPRDLTRASKCFQKAFELDAREAEAARRLAEAFVAEQEWDLAEIVAKRTIEGEGGTTSQDQTGSVVIRHIPANVWAWKIVGIVALNKQDYTDAIQSFQVALRSAGEDSVAWLRLGEAYALAGRYTASLRALSRAEQLSPEDYVCKYQIAEVTRELGDYQTAIDLYSKVIDLHPSDLVLHAARCNTRLSLARSEQAKGFLERAYLSCVETLEEALFALELEGPSMRSVWKIIADACSELARRPINSDGSGTSAKSALAKVILKLGEDPTYLDQRLGSLIDFEQILVMCQDDGVELAADLIAGKAAIASSNYCIHLAGNNDAFLSASYYDLSVHLSELVSAQATFLDSSTITLALDLAIEYVKKAIRIQPDEPLYWNCLGSLTVENKPKLSQHAFIRAIQNDPKDPILWCNLGLLYIKNADDKLAQEAFSRAQVVDPDCAMSWVGQALVAGARRDIQGSLSLLEHAVSLTADMPIPNLEFAYRVFASLSRGVDRSSSNSDIVISAFFALERCLQRRSNDILGLHLAALISERIGLTARAAIFAQRCAKILEAVYERSEDPQVARKYAITQATLGRVLLAEGDFGGSLAAFETVLGLIDKADADSGDATDNEAQRLRCIAHLSSGLANLLAGEIDSAIPSFDAALEEAPPSLRTQCIILQAQTMWILGTEEARDMAKTLLLDCIGGEERNLDAIVVLSAIATLMGDETLLDAALSEIITMSPKERQKLDHLHRVDTLLIRHHLLLGSLVDAVKVAKDTLELDPGNDKSRLYLCELLIRQSNYPEAVQLLKVETADASTAAARLRLLSIASLAADKDSAKIVGKQLMEKAVALAPWEAENWTGLAYASV